MKTLIKGATIVNEDLTFKGNILIEDETIFSISKDTIVSDDAKIIDGTDHYLIPGVIDDQVHFREPGVTYKGEIYTEAKSAVAGGVTSFMEMPNTKPNTLTQELLQEKYNIGAERSLANYSFYMGVSNDNLKEVLKTNPKNVCGLKIFMGASTGNMLVDNRKTLEAVFSESLMLIATHCEDENTIRRNIKLYREKYGEDMPLHFYPDIRSEEACYKSSALAVELAEKYNSRLHILHLSTQKEMALFTNKIPLSEKKITAEVCVHHLWFSAADYDTKGTLIKWNPAIKQSYNRQALIEAVNDNTIDVIATDHAPHTLEEKQNTYFNAPAGGPLVQHSLISMLEYVEKGIFTMEHVVKKMCHDPAVCFKVHNRGFIREGYKADLVLIKKEPNTVTKENILCKCGWSPFEGETFTYSITHTFVNGNLVFDNGVFNENTKGQRLAFER